ncbi:MAG: 5'/3'-nucleotidase SurE [Candidatus Delongbacteria bacterium]|nr:5'/3'-nucleotidase SurE [Candidatus Delongbacteria bacterium]MBN2835873.1 5'/3'-nucleotidase SurE [Candidatus Delongbacteria bacterium]
MKYNILLTNDDGFDAKGIIELHDKLKNDYNVYVLAPESEQSGFSHKITLDRPILLRNFHIGDYKGYKLNGTPCDCTKLALHNIYADKIDLVVSGINRGSNNGISVHYSGTVAAVKEAAFHNVPGVAISLYSYFDEKFDEAAIFLKRYLDQNIETIIKRKSTLNINIPERVDYNKDPVYCKLGLGNFTSPYLNFKHERRNFFFAGGPEKDIDLNDDNDDKNITDDRITITPLTIDMTNFEELKFWKK